MEGIGEAEVVSGHSAVQRSNAMYDCNLFDAISVVNISPEAPILCPLEATIRYVLIFLTGTCSLCTVLLAGFLLRQPIS